MVDRSIGWLGDAGVTGYVFVIEPAMAMSACIGADLAGESTT